MSSSELYEKAKKVIDSVDSVQQAEAMRNYFIIVKARIPVTSVYWDMLWSAYIDKLNELGMNYKVSWDRIKLA